LEWVFMPLGWKRKASTGKRRTAGAPRSDACALPDLPEGMSQVVAAILSDLKGCQAHVVPAVLTIRYHME
jgi:hypothetical protein